MSSLGASRTCFTRVSGTQLDFAHRLPGSIFLRDFYPQQHRVQSRCCDELRHIILFDPATLFRSDDDKPDALTLQRLHEMPLATRRNIASIKIRRRSHKTGKTTVLTRQLANGTFVKQTNHAPVADDDVTDTLVEVTFCNKVKALELAARYLRMVNGDETTSVDALVQRLQQARQISVTTVTATLPEPAVPSTIDVKAQPAPIETISEPELPLLDVTEPEPAE
jgi:hypothetical protein